MLMRKNWFFYLTLLLFELFVLCALALLVFDRGAGEAKHMDPAIILFGLALVALVHLLAIVAGRVKLAEKIPRSSLARNGLEAAGVVLILLLGTVLRLSAIERFPVLPSSDYATYYQVAALLAEGRLAGSGFAGYVAAYPHVFGFPWLLSLLFRITGPTWSGGLLLNVCFSMLAVFFAYRAARLLGGRLCGFLALGLGALWPSQILYSAILASEPAFTAALMLAFWLFVYLMRYPQTAGTAEQSVFLSAVLGAVLALAGALRPMAIILLIAVLLCLLPCRTPFDENRRMLHGPVTRAACQGWFRALITLFAYVLCAQLITGAVSLRVAQPLPPSGAAFGYSLMVGVNQEANGAWNAADAELFNRLLAERGDPRAAHGQALSIAAERIRADPRGMYALAMRKFAYLWENDDYGADWVKVFLDQQGRLTPERQSAIELFRVLGRWFYAAALLFSALCGLRLRKRPEANPAQALMLLFVGTALLHLALETQNRYHYFVLQAFMLLAALGISDIFRRYGKPRK